MAPEFYDTIPSHPSWPMVIINFILDNEVGIFARAKRLSTENAKAAKKALLDGSDSDKSE
jgi:sphingolipid delta-4 desaturase